MKTGIYAIACPGDAAFIRRRKRFGACLRNVPLARSLDACGSDSEA